MISIKIYVSNKDVEKLKASETNLQAMIEGTKQYIIPMFQRTYSWKEKQWKQLWEDIIDLTDDDENSSHFIGSIVSIPINTSTHGVQQFLVIDGQQRLTTLFILLAALRDFAEGQKKELADEIHNTLLINSYKKGEEWYKFLPTQVDKEAFKKVINNEITDDHENSLIVKAYKFFSKFIAQSSIDIVALKNTITTNLSIVSIVLSPDDNPYLVFESLNAKGQPLTQSDLIRNYLFMRIPAEDQEDYYQRYWLPMQEKLEDNLTEFIRHFLLGVNINVKKNDVYVKFKDKVGNQDVKEFFRTLSMFAGYYAKLLDPQLEEDNLSIRQAIKRINDFEAKTAYPFLLYIYQDFKKGKYDTKQFCEILSIIENYLVRRFVCNIDSKPLNKMFAALYNQISTYEASQSIEELIAYLQNRGYPKDSEVIASLKENQLYGQGDRRKKGSFIIKSIESSYSHKEKVDLTNATIEHIMPQTLTEKWKDELGENADYIHSTYLHTLGNLTLTAYNSELSNEPFSVKKKYYKKSNIELNKNICTYDKWNQESIEQRSGDLINKFLCIWPYFGKKENEETKVTGTSPRLLIMHQHSYPVKTWREVLEKTIMYIYKNNNQNYETIMSKNSGLLSIDNKQMRSPKKLPNGHYIETNLSAKSIYNFCLKVFEEARNDKKDWHVETVLK